MTSTQATTMHEITPSPSQLESGTKPTKAKLIDDEHHIPSNNLWIIIPGLMLTVFLAALDQTIVSTALPVIAEKLHSGPSGYAWVGTAYLLVVAALNPLYARASDFVGRKPLLWVAIIVFLAGSALCGASQTMTMLCICRGVQGCGGAGVIVLCNVILSDLVPLSKRGAAQGAFGAVWGVAACLGPLLGGLLTDKLSWRWCFFVNLPVGGVAALLLVRLNLNPPPKRSLSQMAAEFDFVGLLTLTVGVVLLLLGFSEAETNSFSDPKSIAFLCVGGVLLVFVLPYIEFKTTRKAIIPPRLFRTRTTMLVLFSVIAHGLPFFAGTYYLPQYFQAVTGSSPLFSGVQMLPFSLLSAVMSTVSGLAIVRLQSYRPVLWFGFAVMTLGYALMATLTSTSSVAKQELYIAVAAVGLGCLFQTPLIALTAATPLKDMAATTGALQVVRAVSGSAGISLAGAIYNSVLRKQLARIPDFSPADVQGDVRGLIHLQPPELARDVTHAYGEALRVVWLVCAPIVGAGLLSVLFVKQYSLQRKVVRDGDETPRPLDEKAASLDATDVEAATRSSAEPEHAPALDDAPPPAAFGPPRAEPKLAA